MTLEWFTEGLNRNNMLEAFLSGSLDDAKAKAGAMKVLGWTEIVIVRRETRPAEDWCAEE